MNTVAEILLLTATNQISTDQQKYTL